MKDIEAAGPFIYAVKTTGIYCRPGCSSRTPKRENVLFFETCEGAREAGFRACLRCCPNRERPGAAEGRMEQNRRIIAAACRRLENAVQEPSLESLAETAGISAGHFHKLFKSTVGLSPHEYAAALRSGRLLAAVEDGMNVTSAVYEAGYSAPSRAYDELKGYTALTPSQHGRGAPGIHIDFAVVPCHLGWAIVAITGKGLCSVMFADSPSVLPGMLAEGFPGARLREISPTGSALVAEALKSMDTPGWSTDLPLDIEGTVFQKRVWKALQAIPAGQTATYGEIARNIGKPNAVRAVANACGANKIALFIPCHRIIRSDGKPGGYHWGIDRKRLLLREEKVLEHS